MAKGLTEEMLRSHHPIKWRREQLTMLHGKHLVKTAIAVLARAVTAACRSAWTSGEGGAEGGGFIVECS